MNEEVQGKTMKIGSLFAGIGGIELGLERAGLGHAEWQVEWGRFQRAILAKHWPGANRSIRDVRDATCAKLGPVDVMCGGFPCQDISRIKLKSKGGQQGLAGKKSGLWKEYLRLIKECSPKLVVAENVQAIEHNGLPEVIEDLNEAGYSVNWCKLSVYNIGASVICTRMFILGHQGNAVLLMLLLKEWMKKLRPGHPVANRQVDSSSPQRLVETMLESNSWPTLVASTSYNRSIHLQMRMVKRMESGDPTTYMANMFTTADMALWKEYGPFPPKYLGFSPYGGETLHGFPIGWTDSRSEEPIKVVGFPAPPNVPKFDYEPPMGVHKKLPDRLARISTLGNCVVPQCSEFIGRVLVDFVKRSSLPEKNRRIENIETKVPTT